MEGGGTLPRSSSKFSAYWNNTECGKLLKEKDWSKTSLGSIETWSQTLLAHCNSFKLH